MDALAHNKAALRKAAWPLALLAVLFLIVWFAPPQHAFEGISKYQSIHLPVETASLIISMLIFGVAWNAYSQDRASNIILLACASLAVGLIDFAHMLSFAGMPDWVTPAGPEKAINFWLAARFIFAAALLSVALRPWQPLARPNTRYTMLTVAILVSAVVYWIGLFHQDALPRTFIAGTGLTMLKIAAEYFIVMLLMIAGILFWRQAHTGKPREAVGLFSVALITVLSELSFTLYSDVTDVFNLLGHVYKIIAYIILYRTVFVGSVQEPFLRVLNAEQSLHHANRALKTLSAGNKTLLHAREERALLDAMCRATVEKGGYLLAWVGYVQQDEARSIKPEVWHAVQPGYVESLLSTWQDIALNNGPSGVTVRSGEATICQDIASDPLFAPWRDEAMKYGYRASIALPLHNNGSTFATLSLYADTPHAFTDDEIALLSEMSEDLSFGIRNLRMRAERDQALQEKQHFLETIQEGLQDTVQAIAATVEMRDPYTAGHQRRVADLAAAIAGEMNLPHEEIFAIHLAGVVHDLGKISIPAEILSKPARLSEIEYDFIKTHPQAGYDILKDIDFQWPVAEMVLQHHERMDGSGYPQGLQGDAIILGARILAVADVIEAMASHRPYRPGLGIEAALNEIREHRGVRYDADVADAASRLFSENKYQL
ncbi:MAG: GAF domain-containing protein [Gammaproteobacteria bacterium]|nr:HD domain-containing protein [Sideroxydans sp.]MBU3903288.1 GAF domain-containing protein [Gammaproteobacteria bacterium]